MSTWIQLYKRKTLFKVSNVCLNKKKNLFKNFFFINIFLKQFNKQNFNLFYYFILKRNKYALNSYYQHLTLKFLPSVFKYEYFFFFKNWKLYENLIINRFFRFNNHFLGKKWLFLDFFQFNFNWLENKISRNLKQFETKLFENCFKFLEISRNLKQFETKLICVLNNLETFNLHTKNLKNCKKIIFLSLLEKSFFPKNNFVTNYVSYQAFINTHLYLIWTILFINIFSTSSFDYLLLRNLNRVLFRIGDIWNSTFLSEFFVWGERGVIYWRGEPYLTFNLNKNKNTFIPFPSFYFLSGYKISNYSNFNNFIFINNILYL